MEHDVITLTEQESNNLWQRWYFKHHKDVHRAPTLRFSSRFTREKFADYLFKYGGFIEQKNRKVYIKFFNTSHATLFLIQES